MKKNTFLISLTLVILLLSATALYAQNGNPGGLGGQGMGGPPCGPNGRGIGPGGIGIPDSETGNCWEGREQGQNQGMMNGRGGFGANGAGLFIHLPPAVEGELPANIVELMTAGLNDERAAYAVYEAITEAFGDVAPFSNLMQAEAQHITAWEFMFERYGLVLPEEAAVEFTLPDTVTDACAYTAELETANFGLYDTMIESFTDYPDLAQVASALRDASQFHHLPALERCASR